MEKIKATRREIEEMYDIEDEPEHAKGGPDPHEAKEKKNFTFDQYTTSYDKEEVKEFEDGN